MKKKSGFTLLEMILVIALGLVILSITFSLFINITKTNIYINITSTLQTEAQNISQSLSNSGMESSGVSGVVLQNGTTLEIGESDEKKYSELSFVDSNGKFDSSDSQNKNNQWISIKEIKINNKYEKVNVDGSEEIDDVNTPFTISYDQSTSELFIEKEKFDNNGTPTGSTGKVLVSEHVGSILIRPKNAFVVGDSGNVNIEGDGKISNATSIEIKINLEKKKGSNDVKYSVPITVTFRNKAIV